jgi:threonine dehydrogenase-like Zn-dependent dehydrogenase
VGPELKDSFRTHLECSGQESAVMAGVQVVGRLGEVLLVGVPWRTSTDITAHALLEAVFKRYVSIRSGWEWQVPRYRQPNQNNSIEENYLAAMEWLRGDRIATEGLAELYRPEQAGEVYDGLARRSLPTIAAMFDWRRS